MMKKWNLLLALLLAPAGAFAATPVVSSIWNWQLTDTTVGLSMAVDSLSVPAQVHFQYGTDPAFTGAAKTSGDSMSASSWGCESHANLSGLKPGTKYYYKAVAAFNGGVSEKRGEFTTLAALPPVVRSISVTNVSHSGAGISASVFSTARGSAQVAFGTDPSLTGAAMSRANSIEGGASGGGSHHDLSPALKPGVKYYYQLIATNPYGTGKSAIGTFTTPGGTAKAPVVEKVWSWNLTGATGGLSMAVKNDGQDGSCYFLYGKDASMAGAAKAGASSLEGSSWGIESHATLSGLTPKTVYYYQAVVTTPIGTAKSGVASFTTL